MMERYNEEIKEKEKEEEYEKNREKERWIIGLHNINGMVFEKYEGKENQLEKIQLTEDYLKNRKVLIHNICETWFKEDFKDEAIRGYQTFRGDRHTRSNENKNKRG